MTILLILCSLVILLIYIAIYNSLLYISLRLVTGKKFEEKKLILPSFLNFILLLLFTIITYFILSSNSLKGIPITIMNLLFKATSLNDIFSNTIFPIVLLTMIFFILSTFCLLTVNINYNKLKWDIKIFLNKIFKKKNKNTPLLNEETTIFLGENLDNNNLKNDTINCKDINYKIKEMTTDEVLNKSIIIKEDENDKITYLNSLVANIFIFALTIFTFTIFFSIGYLLSDKILKML